MGIRLEVLGAKHLEWLRNLRNANREWFLNSKVIETFQQQEDWFVRSAKLGDLNLVIFETSTDERVGFISLYDIHNTIAVVGRMMVEDKFKHQGYMLKALIKVCHIAKYYLEIKELTLEVLKSNVIARDFYTKIGFVTHGITTEYLIMRKFL